MKKIIIALLIMVMLGTSADALTLASSNKVEIGSGEYTIHYIYRSESYWKTKKYDKEVIEIKEFNEAKTLNFREDKEVGSKEYNYMACLVGDKKDGSTNIYAWYNNYD